MGFSIGQRVVNKVNKMVGTVSSYAPPRGSVSYYWINYDFALYGSELVSGTDLELFSKDETLPSGNVTAEKRCECGACKTTFPDFHSDWCPLFKEI